MKKQLIKLIAVCALAAFAATATVRAEDSKDAKPVQAGEAKKDRPVPFRGKIESLDKAAKTITIGKEKKRTIHVTDKTRIMKDGKTAMLDDAKVGDEVAGSYREMDGKMEAGSLRIGPKMEDNAKPKKEKKKE
ncbi:MAG: hypothetical protein ABJC04_08780 [Verrucomicrobiota bacterium]